MIRRFDISGFKRFAHNAFDFEPLVVLAGLNGTGKTSVIQALLLCRAAMDNKHGTVPLNGGPFGLDLGTAEDIHNRESTGDLVFSLNDQRDQISWRFAVP
jgi:predicted ATPase